MKNKHEKNFLFEENEENSARSAKPRVVNLIYET